MRELLAAHPGKSYVERWWLLYTPVWGAITGVVMLGGLAERWGDLPCLLLGLGLAGGALAAARRAPARLARPCCPGTHARGVQARGLAVLLLAFGLNYTQTPFFFDVLHMHYGFHDRVERSIEQPDLPLPRHGRLLRHLLQPVALHDRAALRSAPRIGAIGLGCSRRSRWRSSRPPSTRTRS
jgi:hypothetical protein